GVNAAGPGNNDLDDTDTDNQQFFLSDMNLNGSSVFENVFDDDDDDDDVETHSIVHSDLLNDMDSASQRASHNASGFPNFWTLPARPPSMTTLFSPITYHF
ncbi:Sodium- and chloride-dependent GABA transporter 1, partial [Fusarium falciforme]